MWAGSERQKEKKREERTKMKTNVHDLIYSALHDSSVSTPSLPCLSVRHWRILGLHNSSLHYQQH